MPDRSADQQAVRSVTGGDGDGVGAPPAEAPARPPADPRLALVVAELRRRLRPVCRDWADPEFEALVHRIARTKLRWADRAEPQ
jgi:hypothetical protein